jgi:competence protein ComEC
LAEPGSDADAAKRAGVLAALVVGDQAAIDRSDWDVFRATGVAHLMSISGLHVTMFAWLASALVGWAWRRSALWGFVGPLRWPAVHVGAVAGLFLAGFYALFSGWGLPAQRTLLMLLVVVVLRVSARHWHGALVWLTACAVVLAWDPWALLQPGFWLSFVAVGVLMASDPHAQRQSGLAPQRDAGDAPTWRRGASPESFSHRFGALWLSGGWAGWWTLGGAKLGSLLKEQAKITNHKWLFRRRVSHLSIDLRHLIDQFSNLLGVIDCRLGLLIIIQEHVLPVVLRCALDLGERVDL